jgi:hypothetical protein
MGAASEHELISRELLNALNHAAELESELHEAFQTSGATSLVNTARMLTSCHYPIGWHEDCSGAEMKVLLCVPDDAPDAAVL